MYEDLSNMHLATLHEAITITLSSSTVHLYVPTNGCNAVVRPFLLNSRKHSLEDGIDSTLVTNTLLK